MSEGKSKRSGWEGLALCFLPPPRLTAPLPPSCFLRERERERKCLCICVMPLAEGSSRIGGSGLEMEMNRCLCVYAPESEGEEGGAVCRPDDDRPVSDRRNEPGVDDDSGCSSTSSSIGRNSSSGAGSRSSDGEDGGEPEVQSSYKGPLDAMDSLEESLPIRKGISKFYSGKSKSFTSLSDAAAAKDLAKPEDPYNKKRKNLLLVSSIWQRNRYIGQPLRNSGSGISKRHASSCRCLVTFADTVSSSEEVANGGEGQQRQQLPPLPPGGRSSSRGGSHSSSTSPPQWSFASRSFSLVDLQGLTSSVCCPDKQNNAVH